MRGLRATALSYVSWAPGMFQHVQQGSVDFTHDIPGDIFKQVTHFVYPPPPGPGEGQDIP